MSEPMVEKVLVLWTCNADMSGRNREWSYPESGHIEARRPATADAACSNGLQGLMWGVGEGGNLHLTVEDAKWLVMEVDAASVTDLGGKVKFQSADVVYCGDRAGAIAYLDANGGADKAVFGAARTAGYQGSATAGYRGSATAGYQGSATAGYQGSATAGDRGSATAGDRGSARASSSGVIVIHWYDSKIGRTRLVVGYVGEDGLKANTWYCLDEDHQFIQCSELESESEKPRPFDARVKWNAGTPEADLQTPTQGENP